MDCSNSSAALLRNEGSPQWYRALARCWMRSSRTSVIRSSWSSTATRRSEQRRWRLRPLTQNAIRPRLSDVAADRNAERLRQLSDEVSRIAATLARLSSNPPVPAGGRRTIRAPATDSRKCPPKRSVTSSAPVACASRYFAEQLFADPAWDMMLDLLQAEIAQLRVPVSSLCIAAAVPATTALCWLKTLVQQGLFVRRADPHDGRRVFVELAPAASEALRRYFSEVGSPAVI